MIGMEAPFGGRGDEPSTVADLVDRTRGAHSEADDRVPRPPAPRKAATGGSVAAAACQGRGTRAVANACAEGTRRGVSGHAGRPSEFGAP